MGRIGRDSSTEFQTRRKWESALDELATLDFDSRSDGTRVRFAAALAALERIATKTLFAPESRHAPVQIMGPLESAGSSFDAVWFLRANDLAWPAKPAPNPLLPWLLQRELAMPGADPAHNTARAQRIADRIAASAPTVLFSYAQQTAEGQQRPSPVVTGLAANGLAIELPQRRRDRSRRGCARAHPARTPPRRRTHPTPARPRSSRRRVHSAAQAACGFRAFAEKRLFSSALDTASLGLDPRERGSLVHAVLERFWAEVETQAALKSLPLDERNALLNRFIDAAFAKDHAHTAPGWPRAYLRTERQRLLKLLGLWLDYEAINARPSPSSRAKRPCATFRSARCASTSASIARTASKSQTIPSAIRKTASKSANNCQRTNESARSFSTTRPALPAPRTGWATGQTRHSFRSTPSSPCTTPRRRRLRQRSSRQGLGTPRLRGRRWSSPQASEVESRKPRSAGRRVARGAHRARRRLPLRRGARLTQAVPADLRALRSAPALPPRPRHARRQLAG